MQFLIVLAAALACAIAEPQFAYTGYTGGVVPGVGYPGYTGYTGYTGGVVPAVGYTGGAVAYAAPLTYSGHSVAAYPGAYPVVSRTRRDVPASTTKLDSVVPLTYAHPAAYATYPYGAPLVKSATPYTYKAYSPVAYSPVAYSTVGAYPHAAVGAYPQAAYPHAYGYPGSVVTY